MHGGESCELSRGVKLLYGVGAVCDSVKSFSFGMFLLFFYVSVRGLSGTAVGTATAIGLLWDALIDPLVGRLSDRSHFGFGRRHTFMLAGALCMAPAFYAVFAPPGALSGLELLTWLIASSVLLRTAQSVFIVPYYALGAELSRDYDVRTSVTGIRATISLLGTMLAAVLSFVVFFPDSVTGKNLKFDPDGYSSMALTFGICMMLAGLVATLGTLGERGRVQESQSWATGRTSNLSTNLLAALRNRPFVILTLSNALFFHAVVINATLAIHYLHYYAGVSASRSISMFLIGFYVGAFAGVGVWMWLSRRVEKDRLYSAGTFGTAVVLALAYFTVGAGNPFGTGNLTVLVLGNSVAGLFGSVVWVLPPSMVADTLDEHERLTGNRNDAGLFGLFSMGMQVAASLALVVSGLLVDHFAGLVPGHISQSPSTINRIGMLYGLLPAGLLFTASVLMNRYPLTRRRVQEVQAELESRKHASELAR